jgi:RNA polymerase sigma factor (sigma-70 family)
MAMESFAIPSARRSIRGGAVSATASIAASSPTGRVDPDALVAELFRTEGAALVRLARIFCDDHDAAEDLVQEAFIRLHRSASTIKDPDRAPAFLRSIVLNLTRDHNRRGLMSLRHRGAMRTRDRDDGFEDASVADHDGRVVLEALRTLPDRQRECLVMRFYLQLSERELADTLGISQNSVKTHCRRGMAALESTLEPTMGVGA